MKWLTHILVFLLASGVLGSEWELIDNFDHLSVGDVFVDAEEIGWYASGGVETDEFHILSTPENSENPALRVIQWSNPPPSVRTSIMKELFDGGLLPGEKGVLFFKAYWNGQLSSWFIGTTDKLLEYDAESSRVVSPGNWADYNAQLVLGSSTAEGDPFRVRDGDSYRDSDPPIIAEQFVWISIWIFIENTFDYDSEPVSSTGRFRVYIKRPHDASLILFSNNTDLEDGWASFRRSPLDQDHTPQPIRYVIFGMTPPLVIHSTSDIALFDDFYFTKLDGWGEYLSLLDPTVSSKDINTGSWFGWLNLNSSPYIWSYALSGWLYMEEPAADAPGAWGYFYK